MPSGQEHVQATLALCREARQAAGMLAGADQGWGNGALGRLQAAQEMLEGLRERFFLRTKLCLPFAARCQQEAQGVMEALHAVEGSEADALERLDRALGLLEKAVKVLDARSAMQGMAIT